jgi:hypothetical protein
MNVTDDSVRSSLRAGLEVGCVRATPVIGGIAKGEASQRCHCQTAFRNKRVCVGVRSVLIGVQNALFGAPDRSRRYQASLAEPGGRSPFNNATTSDCRL